MHSIVSAHEIEPDQQINFGLRVGDAAGIAWTWDSSRIGSFPDARIFKEQVVDAVGQLMGGFGSIDDPTTPNGFALRDRNRNIIGFGQAVPPTDVLYSEIKPDSNTRNGMKVRATGVLLSAWSCAKRGQSAGYDELIEVTAESAKITWPEEERLIVDAFKKKKEKTGQRLARVRRAKPDVGKIGEVEGIDITHASDSVLKVTPNPVIEGYLLRRDMPARTTAAYGVLFSSRVPEE